MKTPDAIAVGAFLDDRHVELAARIADFSAREIALLPEPADDGAGRAQARRILELLGREGWFAPTLHLKNVDKRCGRLDYIRDKPRRLKVDYVMSNNFAFGGVNTSLIFRRWEDAGH